MTGSRKVLLVIVALAVPAYFLPVTRDELSWWWTQSQSHSDDYLHYLSDWPHGRHAAEARVFARNCLWTETKKAEILKAYKMAATASAANAETEAVYRREKGTRRDNFSWKRATVANTIASYNDYLSQYPEGLHAGEAREKIQSLGQSAMDTNTTPP